MSKSKKSHVGPTDLALFFIWVFGVLTVGTLLAFQSAMALKAGTDTAVVGGRVTLISLLLGPLVGALFSVVPVTSRHRSITHPASLNAALCSLIYLACIFALLWFENDYYPGQLMTMFGFWGLASAVIQGYVVWSLRRLSIK